jgi:four helix bundle protein
MCLRIKSFYLRTGPDDREQESACLTARPSVYRHLDDDRRRSPVCTPSNMTSETLTSRTEAFARRIVTLCLPLLDDARTHLLARHLLRSGTGANANYGSAQRGRTNNEFAARLQQACDDIAEARDWIDVLRSVSGEHATEELGALRTEAEDLGKLLTVACRAARASRVEDAIGR